MFVYIYETDFKNGRPNFLDMVLADTGKKADIKATNIIRGISDEYGCDEDAEVNIIGALASTPETVAEDIRSFYNE